MAKEASYNLPFLELFPFWKFYFAEQSIPLRDFYFRLDFRFRDYFLVNVSRPRQI